MEEASTSSSSSSSARSALHRARRESYLNYGSSEISDDVCETDKIGFEPELHNCSISRSGYDDSWGSSSGTRKMESISVRTRFCQRERESLNGRDNECGSSKIEYRRNYDAIARFADLENDRAELLRKIDELKEQLSKTCDVGENSKQRIGVESRISSTSFDPYIGHDLYRHQGFNVLEPTITRPSYQQPYQYVQETYHNQYPNNSPFHQPPCSCSQCHSDSILYQHKVRGSVIGHAQVNFNLGHRNSPRNVIVPHGIGRMCRAISGGAPFITCCNCFELLQIPKKLSMMGKNKNKMRCGACSFIMFYELSAKGIVLSVPKQVSDALGNKKPNSDESVKIKDARSSLSSSFSEHEESKGSVIGRDNAFSVAEAAERCFKVTKQSSEVEEPQESVATEMDISMNESVNSGVSQHSQESFEVSKDDDGSSHQKGSEPFAGLTKRSSGETSVSEQNSEDMRRSGVFVNGQLIPARDVKMAEKLAGPIQLGNYWYDSRAGFWGVEGHPCFGIIPPNIEEFNYPMPKGCAAGNTGVFVNGRELHQKDLDLLANRGLPTTKNKSYLVEISGKVVDGQTGKELDSLGKLAPTIERVKHGFGMKVPKSIAEQLY